MRFPRHLRRWSLAASACLLWVLPLGLARGADAPAPPPGDSFSDRARTIAGQAYDLLRQQVLDPASAAAAAALASPLADQAYRQFDATMRALAGTVDDQVLQPLGQAASDALNSPAAHQARDLAGSTWDNVVAGMHRYVIDPLSDLASPAPGGGAGLDERSGPGPGGAVAAAVSPPSLGPELPNDPLEPINRQIFALNAGLRSQLLEPVTQFYRGTAPDAVQESVQNFFANLREPITVVSSLLEGELGDAGNSAARFGINTTLGIVGIYDPATGYGYKRRVHNLEEALCVYRLPSGPYLVLPIYGPATLRDAVGRVATIFAYFEAMGFSVYVPYRIGDAVAQSAAPSLAGGAEKLSPDPYLTQKMLYFGGGLTGCGRYARNAAASYGP